MAIIIVGSEGNIGRRLKRAFPGSFGIDRVPGADLVADLAAIDYANSAVADVLGAAEAVIHVATSADAYADAIVHWQAVANTTRLVAACAEARVPRLVLPSSDWAEPKAGMSLNAYGWSKRVIEALAGMYSVTPGCTAVALRIGWIPLTPDEVAGAADWLKANYWDDARLIDAFRRALTGPPV